MVSQNKLLMYVSIGLAFLGALFAMIGGGGIFSMIGGIAAGIGGLLGILFSRYGYIMIPLITKGTKTIMITDTGFEVPPSQDVIVKESQGTYYASAFLGLKIFESASEKSSEENVLYNESFERAISNLRNVTKIAYMLYVEDIGEKRKTIEAKRAEAQLRLAREREKPEPDVLRIDKYEREVALWDLQLNKLVKGIKPMGVIAYAMTTATGVSKEGAIAGVKVQANELKSILANSLNVEVEWLTADEMLKCFEWERMMPTSPQELEESVV
ncbi:MAG: hypothetical protein AABW86_02015 [Candidatus Micrarchaeota archaeon]